MDPTLAPDRQGEWGFEVNQPIRLQNGGVIYEHDDFVAIGNDPLVRVRRVLGYHVVPNQAYKGEGEIGRPSDHRRGRSSRL